MKVLEELKDEVMILLIVLSHTIYIYINFNYMSELGFDADLSLRYGNKQGNYGHYSWKMNRSDYEYY